MTQYMSWQGGGEGGEALGWTMYAGGLGTGRIYLTVVTGHVIYYWMYIRQMHVLE